MCRFPRWRAFSIILLFIFSIFPCFFCFLDSFTLSYYVLQFVHVFFFFLRPFSLYFPSNFIIFLFLLLDHFFSFSSFDSSWLRFLLTLSSSFLLLFRPRVLVPFFIFWRRHRARSSQKNVCLHRMMRCGTIRYGMTRYDTLRRGPVQYDTPQCGTIRYRMLRYDTVRYITFMARCDTVRLCFVRYCMVWLGTVWYGAVRYNAVRYNAVP